MKIALIGPTLTSACRQALGLALEGAPPGVAQTPIAPLAAQLRKMGHEVHVITTDPTVETARVIEEDGFSITYCPLRGEPRYRARVRALDFFEKEIQSLSSAIKALQPDIVHAHWTYEFAEAALRSGRPHLVTMHDLGWEYFWQFRDVYRFVRLLMKYRTMPRIQNLTVVAPFMAKKSRQYGYLGSVDVIPNGIEMPLRVSLRSAVDLTRPRIVTVGNSGNIKNVRSSVAAFREIRLRRPMAELHLFGPGLDNDYAAGEPGVVGHGDRPHGELMDFLATQATIIVHPSKLETFGVVIAEAKARGVPVVAGRRSGGVSYVCDDGFSRIVDINSPTAICEAALDLMSNMEAYTEAAEHSALDVRQRFSASTIANMYLASYEKVLLRARA
jgi:glycosyltransferase involved in cell wall biosynthesis